MRDKKEAAMPKYKIGDQVCCCFNPDKNYLRLRVVSEAVHRAGSGWAYIFNGEEYDSVLGGFPEDRILYKL